MSKIPVMVLCSAMIAGLSAGALIAGTPDAIIAKHDKDGDKTLDLAEVRAAAAAQFDKLEKDGDGTLDAHELKGVITPTALRTADPDNDGTLTKDEYLALAEKQFHQADTDHDGSLDAKELGSKSGTTLVRMMGG